MKTPLVSIVCLCYNHEQFVAEAIQSVKDQTYPNIQLIIVDDHSADRSAEIIKKSISLDVSTEFLELSANVGNCRAFNCGLEKAEGDFVIDLSADDVLFPERVAMGMAVFQSMDESVGVNFADAQLIDDAGKSIGYHSDRFPHGEVPQGNIYKEVLSKYFINGPTMMIRMAVLKKLGGYDPTLAYEDFDFWVRSSREYKYCYTPEPLVKRRIVRGSLGQQQYLRGSAQLNSTLAVCKKAFSLNRSKEEHQALRKRILFEMRQAIGLGEVEIALGYWKLWRQIP